MGSRDLEQHADSTAVLLEATTNATIDHMRELGRDGNMDNGILAAKTIGSPYDWRARLASCVPANGMSSEEFHVDALSRSV